MEHNCLFGLLIVRHKNRNRLTPDIKPLSKLLYIFSIKISCFGAVKPTKITSGEKSLIALTKISISCFEKLDLKGGDKYPQLMFGYSRDILFFILSNTSSEEPNRKILPLEIFIWDRVSINKSKPETFFILFFFKIFVAKTIPLPSGIRKLLLFKLLNSLFVFWTI